MKGSAVRVRSPALPKERDRRAMSRGSSRAVAACAALIAIAAAAGVAEADAATESAAKKPRFAAATQTSILKRGVTLILRGRGKVKVSVSSSTFDDPAAGRLTRRRVVRLRGKGR